MSESAPLAPRPFRFAALWTILAASFIMALPALQGVLLGYDDVNLIEAPGGAARMGLTEFFTGLYYYAYTPFYGLSYWLGAIHLGRQEPAPHDGATWYGSGAAIIVVFPWLIASGTRGPFYLWFSRILTFFNSFQK